MSIVYRRFIISKKLLITTGQLVATACNLVKGILSDVWASLSQTRATIYVRRLTE